jgi:hypothetical protein
MADERRIWDYLPPVKERSPKGFYAEELRDAATLRTVQIPVENLGAGADIAARLAWVAPHDLTVTKVSVLSQGTAAGIDATNTCVVAVANGANNIVSKTYNNTTTFPATDTQDDLGTPDATQKKMKKGDLLKLSVTNGATADPPAFVVQVEYIGRDVT